MFQFNKMVISLIIILSTLSLLPGCGKKSDETEKLILTLLAYDRLHVTWGELQDTMNSSSPKCSVCHGANLQAPDLGSYSVMSGSTWSKCASRDAAHSRFYIALTPVGVMHHVNPSISNRAAPVVRGWIESGCPR
jgi:hypothetical protein